MGSAALLRAVYHVALVGLFLYREAFPQTQNVAIFGDISGDLRTRVSAWTRGDSVRKGILRTAPGKSRERPGFESPSRANCLGAVWNQKQDLTTREKCNTLLDMKTATLTIRLDKDLNALLSKATKRSGKNRSEIAREALRRQLRLQQFEELRKRIMPFAEARGLLTDEDIFSQIS